LLLKKVNLLACLTMFLLVALVFAMAQQRVVSSALASSAEVTENSWVTKASMNEARAYLGVAVVNGKIYAIGGDVGEDIANVSPGTTRTNAVVSTNEEYDPDVDMWTFKTSMPTARAGFAVAVYKNRIYCIGGWTKDYSNAAVNEVYDSATDTWETKTAMPAPLWGVRAFAVAGKIYVMGSSSNVTYVYDPETDSWASKTPPPYETTTAVLDVVDDKIYSIGSYMSYSDPANPRLAGAFIQIYDTVTDSWSIGGNASTYGTAAAIGVTSGAWVPKGIYFFEETTTHIYDLANESWTVGASMLTARLCGGVAVVNDTFYVVGGRSGQHGYITMMYPSAVTEQYIPFGYGSIKPVVSLLYPEGKTYNVSTVPLTFTVDKPVSLMQYSLDGKDNVTIAGNTTLTGLPNGVHNVTVYAKYTQGSIGTSETVTFTIAKEPEPFPTILVAAASAAAVVAIASIGLLYYSKNKKQKLHALQ